MQFKDLDWKDHISDNILVSSHCEINLCGWIKIDFRINYEPNENKYYLYSYGKGRTGDYGQIHMVLWNQQRMQRIGYTAMRWQGSRKRLIIWWQMIFSRICC